MNEEVKAVVYKIFKEAIPIYYSYRFVMLSTFDQPIKDSPFVTRQDYALRWWE